MKNKSSSIKALFIKKMAYSALIQFIIFGIILLLARDYFHNQMSTFSRNLIINDSFTTDEIGRYQLLNNKDALDLVLYNLGNERKLDSIKFIAFPNSIEDYLGDCGKNNSNNNFMICKATNGQISGITLIKKDDKILGYVVARKQYNSIYTIPASYGLLFILLVVVGIFLFNFLFLFLSMRKKIAKNTEYLLDFISSHQTNNAVNFAKVEIDEYRQIANKFIDEHREIISLQKEKAYYEVRKNIAEQVAHDIRSPLAAINTAVSDVTSIPENKRIMIRNAAKRINDIANNLLLQSKNNFFDCKEIMTDMNDSPELIFVVLDNIVAEKRYEYYKTNVNINLNGSVCSYNCFSNINPGSFKRVLSNLINNSIEAVNSSGSIVISLTCTATHVEIIIEDDGCGIPSDILPKVTEQGFSFNKKNGAGFGLSYTKQYLEQINGTMHIHSEEKIGTKITISLLRSNHPIWFCDSMNIKHDSVVVVLDDDPSIHDAWDERFATISHVKLIHFYNVSELLEHNIDPWVAMLYLVDYELLADVKNGLDVIEELKLNDKAILVTSCFEDIAIRARCENIGVKIIPKSYVPYIQIIQQIPGTKHPSSLVFIDDDEMMRTTWIFAAEDAGKSISTYSSFEEFINELNNYSKSTTIYIDSDLGNNIKGEVCAKHLFDKGFSEIHLATGHSKDRFDYMPWIKTVVGKEPPFLLKKENVT
ncbi:sensor histidine kinase [Legionella taurinensis]|uniref:sensor histidine kinase n=1 Tax=Legionella taurinensis TaxID=70611 RepID=UPI00299DE83D|nr:HAMP domain-containing sensor histidine kinase [Legionella taurinensis]MDX1838092.1 HAMP domain-containing sensor histidine kinase [Legionella taurinensis]